MLALLFPGQGSQIRGMGEDLFDKVPEFTSREREIDTCLGFSVRKMCLEPQGQRLNETQYTQPCLFLVNALYYYKAIADGDRPSFFAGHSLGEYDALMAAGAFDLLTGLRLVQKRGELMSHVKNGGMAAIVGLRGERIIQILEENGLTNLDVANYNAPSQTVVSGLVSDINRAAPFFEKAGAQLYLPLQVSAAFHSRYMVDVANAFNEFLGTFTFAPLNATVIANATGQPYPWGDPSKAIRSLLTRQICGSVLWTKSVDYMLANGTTTFKEAGPGDVLTKLTDKITQQRPAAAAASHSCPQVEAAV
ncbi:MAG: ACP S-malonyltransferase [Terracidiphilus sp.]|jgi:malonyl CoA-acyl carrier protein transacylase